MGNWLAARYKDAKLAYAALMKFYPFTLENLDGEIWADIAGYEGLYQVSTFGRVKSLRGRWGQSMIRKLLLASDGYLIIKLSKNNKQKMFRVSRLVAQAFIQNPDSKPQVDHRYGMKFDNFVENLRWVTGDENIKFTAEQGLRKFGEDNPIAKLTSDEVQYIRLNPNNLTIVELAEEFDVCKTTISQVQRGLKYGHVVGKIRDKKRGGSEPTPADICEQIRSEYVKGVPGSGLTSLAQKYGISKPTVRKIVSRK